MNFKTTYILFGAVLAAVGVFALTQILHVKPGTASAYVLPSLHKDTKNPVNPDYFDAVEIDHRRPKEEKLLFLRKESGWEMEKPYTLHVDANQVNALIRQVVDARREDKSDVVKDLKYYELDQPSVVVTLKQGADQEWKLNVGTQGPGSGTSGVIYVTTSDRPDEPLVLRRSSVDTIFKGVDDFRSKDLLEASAFNTSYVNLQEPGKEPVILEKGSDGVWRFEKPAFGEAALRGEGTPGLGTPPGQPKSITGVQDLLEAIGAIRVASNADFGPPDASDSDLAKFGLEKGKPTYLRIEIKRTPGLLGTGGEPKPPVQDALLVGNKVEEQGEKKEGDKEKQDEKKAGDQAEKRYVRLESERAVSKVAVKELDGIARVAANPSLLRNRDLVTVTKSDVDAIDIQNANGLIKIRGKLGKPTLTHQNLRLFVGSGKPRNADDKAVQDLLDTLTKPRLIKDFPDPAKEAEMGFDKPQAVVSLWVNGLKEEEKKDEKADEKKDKPEEKKDAEAEPKLKDEKPTVKLTFGKGVPEGVYVLREMGDKKLLATVPQTVLATVTQGPLAFQDKTLPSFSEKADVAGVVLDRGGTVFDVEHEKKDDQSQPVWKLTKPDTLAGRNADPAQVDKIVAALRGLRPEKLVAEGATDLDRYGLKAPQVKATVKVKGADNKTEDWVYLFGKETEDKSGVYAKQDKQDLVFVVSPDVLTTLRGELQDPTVFRFDSNKVKALKVAGWKKQLSVAITLDLERKGPGDWTVKAPAGFDLDAGQADKFIQLLSHLKAERFVVHQKGPQPEHKLGAPEASLQVEVTVEGERAPLTLTIGDLDAKEKAYYAQASTLPGDVFLVPQAQFEQVLTGPKYFSKEAAAK